MRRDGHPVCRSFSFRFAFLVAECLREFGRQGGNPNALIRRFATALAATHGKDSRLDWSVYFLGDRQLPQNFDKCGGGAGKCPVAPVCQSQLAKEFNIFQFD